SLRSRSVPAHIIARAVCRPVSGLAGLDRLPSRANFAVASRGGPHRPTVAGAAAAYGMNSRSPHSRFIGDDEFAADTCWVEFYRFPTPKISKRRLLRAFARPLAPFGGPQSEMGQRCCYNPRPQLTSH